MTPRHLMLECKKYAQSRIELDQLIQSSQYVWPPRNESEFLRHLVESVNDPKSHDSHITSEKWKNAMYTLCSDTNLQKQVLPEKTHFKHG